MKKSKIILAVCCVIALIATVSVSFAVWDTLGAQEEIIQAAFGQNVRVELINNNTFINAGSTLVPKNAICGSTDTTQYTGAKFTVKLLDLDSKSTLKFNLNVLSDLGIGISQYFDINITSLTENASITFDAEALKEGKFVGQISVPSTMLSDAGTVVPGSAEFCLNMAFVDNASGMQGIETIIGRTFSIKIDILAEKV